MAGRVLIIIALGLATSASSVVATIAGGVSDHRRAAKVGGYFVRRKPAWSAMRISRRGNKWRIEVNGAAPPRGPGVGATPSYCQFVAEGTLSGGRIAAKVIPFEGREQMVLPSDPRAKGLPVEVAFYGQAARLTESFSVVGCGLGSDLEGLYQRRTPTRRELADLRDAVMDKEAK